jgi:hypothetical protein
MRIIVESVGGVRQGTGRWAAAALAVKMKRVT